MPGWGINKCPAWQRCASLGPLAAMCGRLAQLTVAEAAARWHRGLLHGWGGWPCPWKAWQAAGGQEGFPSHVSPWPHTLLLQQPASCFLVGHYLVLSPSSVMTHREIKPHTWPIMLRVLPQRGCSWQCMLSVHLWEVTNVGWPLMGEAAVGCREPPLLDKQKRRLPHQRMTGLTHMARVRPPRGDVRLKKLFLKSAIMKTPHPVVITTIFLLIANVISDTSFS